MNMAVQLPLAVSVRRYREKDDTSGITRLFFDSVRHGTSAHYKQSQREAWAPSIPDVDVWRERLQKLSTFVAEDKDGLAGFMTLGPDGHIDLVYVRPNLIGKGVGRLLYDRVESEAVRAGISRLFAEASALAKPFFEKQGWSLFTSQTIERNGVQLDNHRMEKALN